MKKITALFLAASFVALGFLASCESPTSSSSSTTTAATPTTTSVYQATLTLTVGSTWPSYTFAIKPSASSKSIKDVSLTYYVDSVAYAGGITGATWQADWAGQYKSTNETITAGSWLTSTYTPTTVASSDVQIQFWTSGTLTSFSAGHIYFKAGTVDYSDGTSETLSFPSTFDTSRVSTWTSDSSLTNTDTLTTVSF